MIVRRNWVLFHKERSVKNKHHHLNAMKAYQDRITGLTGLEMNSSKPRKSRDLVQKYQLPSNKPHEKTNHPDPLHR